MLPGGQYYVLWVKFNDGKKGQFLSRDRKSSKSKNKDEKIGLYRLFKLAIKYETFAEAIQIYDHREGKPKNGELIFHWNCGNILLHKEV
jgi:hypothetical protein